MSRNHPVYHRCLQNCHSQSSNLREKVPAGCQPQKLGSLDSENCQEAEYLITRKESEPDQMLLAQECSNTTRESLPAKYIIRPILTDQYRTYGRAVGALYTYGLIQDVLSLLTAP